jgi:hypothetical protein
VLAVARDHVITTPAGRRRADALAVKLPKRAWQRLSCGNGAKGQHWYDWALIATSRPEISLLIRRHTSRTSELVFYLLHAAPGLSPPPREGRGRPKACKVRFNAVRIELRGTSGDRALWQRSRSGPENSPAESSNCGLTPLTGGAGVSRLTMPG